MKQIKNDVICKYCMGCNRLLIEEFEGIKNCKNFIAGEIDWESKFIKSIKNKEDKNGL